MFASFGSPRALLVILLTAVAVVALVPVQAIAAPGGETIRERVSASFIGVNSSVGDNCGWGIGIRYGHHPRATSYDIEYWDGYWQRTEYRSVTKAQADDQDQYAGAGNHFLGVTGGTYSPPCSTEEQNADPGRFSQGAKAWAVFRGSTKPTLKVRVTAPKDLDLRERATVKVKVTAGDVSLTSVRLGEGLIASGSHVDVVKRPGGLNGFRLAARASRTFSFTVVGRSLGVSTLRASGTGSSTRGAARGSGAAKLEVIRKRFDVTGTAWGMACTEDACSRSGFQGAIVTATALDDGKRVSATSAADGTWGLRLEKGAYRVAARASRHDFEPIEYNMRVTRDVGDKDFETCTEFVPAVLAGLRETAKACLPKFDWEMPDRVNLTGEPIGKNPAVFNPDTFTVLLTVRRGKCFRGAQYEWKVDGAVTALAKVSECTWKFDADDEGTYQVSVTQKSAGSPDREFSLKVVVQDFLILSFGDSLASGEGLPPFTTRGLGSCHRSKAAFIARAARDLESKDGTRSNQGAKRSSVTFLHLACSGASMKSAYGNLLEEQFDAARPFIGTREVDAIHMTIGINDMAFAGVVKFCLKWEPCDRQRVYGLSGFELGVPEVPGGRLAEVVNYRARQLPARYREAVTGIYRRFASKVLRSEYIYLSGYPTPLHDERSQVCNPFFILGVEIFTVQEARWAKGNFLAPLERQMRGAAIKDRLTYVPAPASFIPHGYCSRRSWFIHPSRAVLQGNPGGVLHPTEAGHGQLADALVKKMRRDLYPGGQPRRPQ